MKKISPSLEQTQIAENIKSGKNVVVDSVAGSGKTTCALFIAQELPNSRILLLTYNARLKTETREKIKKMKIKNMEAHSYHAFCNKYYNKSCRDDDGIYNSLSLKKMRDFCFDMFIIDEAQDISPLYYEFICKIYKDNGSGPAICLFGDKFQSIFQFNDADSRYITAAREIFNFNDGRDWADLKLSASFRLSPAIVDFVNKCMLRDDRIVSVRDGGGSKGRRPRYTCGSVYKGKKCACGRLCPYIPELELDYYIKCGYKAEDIFILAPSIKSANMPIRIFENYVSRNYNINIYIPLSDDDKLDEDVMKDKLVFSTPYQAKGLERKVVILFCFDDSYFRYYKRDCGTLECTNDMYVAVTRASERLSLLHDCCRGPLPFLQYSEISHYCKIINPYNGAVGEEKQQKKNRNICPTALVRFLSQRDINYCFDLLKIEKLRAEGGEINIKTKTAQPNRFQGADVIYENVNEITAAAISSYFEYQIMGINTAKNIIAAERKYDKQLAAQMNKSIAEWNAADWLKVSNYYCSHKCGFVHKTKQIKKYKWADLSCLKKCADRLRHLDEMSGTSVKFEKKIAVKVGEYTLCGYIDCIAGGIVYEFKLSASLQKKDFLQLVIYSYLKETKYTEKILSTMGDRIGEEMIVVKKCGGEFIGKVREAAANGVMTFETEGGGLEIIDSKDVLYCGRRRPLTYRLYNIKNDELYEIVYDASAAKKIVRYLVDKKIAAKGGIDDEHFLSINEEIKSKYCL